MNNIFENAKFGDKFKARNGCMAIFRKKNLKIAELFYDDGALVHLWLCGKECETKDGEYDIVGKWEECINEEKLEKMAEEFVDDGYRGSDYCVIIRKNGLKEGFKMGYRKAKEE